MTHSQIAVAVVSFVFAVAAVCFFVMRNSKSKVKTLRDILSHCFGEPVYAVSFSLLEARDWIKARKGLIDDGCRAVVCKLNKETFKMFAKEFNPDFGTDKYLLMAIVGNDGQNIIQSLLVKYERLDVQLENVLAKGDGVFVVENKREDSND